MFEKILIANRGEIACRIARTAAEMGVRTVAVYSHADAGAKHVRCADEAFCIGPAEARESYLNGEKIIAAAQRAGAQAIHPGYGFLAENAGFREACDAAGLVFIGPPLRALQGMGSKSEAKKLMQAVGVPLLPGYHGDDQDAPRLRAEADRIGYPVLLKPSAGGGGKGMRIVVAGADFDAALNSCLREASSSFGDAHVLIEKFIAPARHVEIQIFGDSFGDCVSLFERDCSVQRRHQKIVEEAPAPGLSAAQRLGMSEAAIAVAKAVDYVGAGTVEFILAPDGKFYFLEMNTRLQVEHPVTEFITGLDLVEWQLRVASGERLPLRQDQIVAKGHAFEARIYAEDSSKNFMPSTGRIVHLRMPAESAHLRVDSGFDEGDRIGPHYDPMIAKLIVHDETRDKALARLRWALAQCEIAGVASNVDFLSRLAAFPVFAEGNFDTGLIEREGALLLPPEREPPDEAFIVAALAHLLSEASARGEVWNSPEDLSPWNARDHWRLNVGAPRRLVFSCEGRVEEVSATQTGGSFRLGLRGRDRLARARKIDDRRLFFECEGHAREAGFVAIDAGLKVFVDGGMWTAALVDPLATAGLDHAGEAALTAPMSGRVVALFAEAGRRVEKGAPLMAIEAMKMEHTIFAPAEGLLKSFRFAVGEQVEEGSELLEFEPIEKT
jgi:3-methylcrotonyl-CoA carboxylase alpha subunit